MAPVESAAPPTQIIEERSMAYLEGIANQETVTRGGPVFIVSVVFPAPYSVAIPESFEAGLADCEAGRTVDMQSAMTQPPPDRGV